MMTATALYWLAGIYLVLAIFGLFLRANTTPPLRDPNYGIRPLRENQAASPEPAPKTEQRVFRVTAYCPCEKCCGEFTDGTTACGHKIQPGDRFCAAPATIPFGTLLDIPGYGKAVPVLDRGGAIVTKGSTRRHEGRTFITDYDRLDVFFPTHSEALQWGVQILTITYSQEKQ